MGRFEGNRDRQEAQETTKNREEVAKHRGDHKMSAEDRKNIENNRKERKGVRCDRKCKEVEPNSMDRWRRHRGVMGRSKHVGNGSQMSQRVEGRCGKAMEHTTK